MSNDLSEMFDRAQVPGTSLKSERPPTPEQGAIFAHATDCPRNLIVRARAGTGKTTAIVGTCRRIKPHKRVIVFAFNTGIADELKTKQLPPNVFISTVHGFCWRAVLRAAPTKPELDKQREAMTDKKDCLVVLSEGCDTYDAVKLKIDSIFTDDEYGVVFSTVHKAKGLEAETVFILEPGLLGNTKRCRTDEQAQQEKNLEYVAITRAMRELIFVKSPAKKSQPSK